MGSLPKNRITLKFRFVNSGVHSAGSLKLRLTKCRGRGTKKAHVCLFIYLNEEQYIWRYLRTIHQMPLLPLLLDLPVAGDPVHFLGAIVVPISLAQMLNLKDPFMNQRLSSGIKLRNKIASV